MEHPVAAGLLRTGVDKIAMTANAFYDDIRPDHKADYALTNRHVGARRSVWPFTDRGRHGDLVPALIHGKSLRLRGKNARAKR